MHKQISKSELLSYLLFVISKRKKLILSVALVTLLSILFFTYLITPTWEGTTKVLIERSSKQSLSVFKDVSIPVGGNGSGVSVASELLSLLTGENMAYDLCKEFHLDERLRNQRFHPDTLRDRIKNLIVDIVMSPKTFLEAIGILPKGEKNWLDESAEEFIDDWQDIEEEEELTSVVNITIYGETPNLAMDIANRMVDLLKERTQSFTREGAKSPYGFVKNQFAVAEKNLKESEEALATFVRENDIVALEEERKLTVSKLDEFETEFLSTSQRQKEIKAQLAEINRELGKQKEKIIISSIMAKNPVVTELEGSLTNLEIKLASLLTEKKEDHPEVQALMAGIKKNKEELKAAVNNVLQSQTESLNPIFQDLVSQAIALETEEFSLAAREQAIQNIIDQLKAKLQGLPQKEFEYSRLKNMVAINASVYQTVKTRLEELALEQESMINEYNIRVLDRAYVSEDADYDWPIWLLNIIAGFFLAIVFGLGSAFLMEYWNDGVINARDVEEAVSLPCLGDVPDLKA